MQETNLETNGSQIWIKQKLPEGKQNLIGKKEAANWKTAGT